METFESSSKQNTDITWDLIKDGDPVNAPINQPKLQVIGPPANTTAIQSYEVGQFPKDAPHVNAVISGALDEIFNIIATSMSVGKAMKSGIEPILKSIEEKLRPYFDGIKAEASATFDERIIRQRPRNGTSTQYLFSLTRVNATLEVENGAKALLTVKNSLGLEESKTVHIGHDPAPVGSMPVNSGDTVEIVVPNIAKIMSKDQIISRVTITAKGFIPEADDNFKNFWKSITDTIKGLWDTYQTNPASGIFDTIKAILMGHIKILETLVQEYKAKVIINKHTTDWQLVDEEGAKTLIERYRGPNRTDILPLSEQKTNLENEELPAHEHAVLERELDETGDQILELESKINGLKEKFNKLENLKQKK